MSDTPRSNLIQDIFNRLSKNSLIDAQHVAGYDQIVGAFDDSLGEIARRRWIEGQPGEATVESGSKVVKLPPDWLIKNKRNREILRAIYTGRDPNGPRPTNPSLQSGVNYNNSYSFGAIGFGSRYSPTSRNLSAPLRAPNPPIDIPEARSALIDGEQCIVFTLAGPSASAQRWDLTYNAVYTIKDATEDEPAINNFPAQWEHILFKVMKVIIAADRSFDLDLAKGNRDPLDAYEKKERIINGICAEITRRGRNS